MVANSGVACSAATAAAVRDWDKVIQLALEHRVLPRIYRNAGALIPQAVKQSMYDHVLRNARNAMSNIVRTIEAVHLLERARIPVIVLKGPLLASRLYGDYGLRVCGDVDLLVRSNDLLRAAHAFSAAGYHHHTILDARSLARHCKLEHDVAFVHPNDDTLIELHGKVAQPHYSYRVNLGEWWAARQTVRVAGVELEVLSPEHTYLLAAMHAARHQWARLDLIGDLAAFRPMVLDRQLIHDAAVSAGLSRVLEIGEALARYYYGDGTLPNDRLACELIAQLLEAKNFSRFQTAWLDVRSRECMHDRIRYLTGRFVHKPLLDMGRRVN